LTTAPHDHSCRINNANGYEGKIKIVYHYKEKWWYAYGPHNKAYELLKEFKAVCTDSDDLPDDAACTNQETVNLPRI
jgi:hypothetical protein